MDYKKIIFNLLGVIVLIPSLILPYLIEGKIDPVSILLGPMLSFLILVLINMFSTFTIGLISGYLPDVDGYVLFFFFPFFFFNKRIYYSDLGYFYLSGKERITIRKIGPFGAKKVFVVYYDDDVESLRQQIKSKLDSLYADELDKKRKKKLLKDWDGYIDLKSKRDDRLNEILGN